MTKYCRKCNQTKSLELFSKNSAGKLGRYSICRICKGKTNSKRLVKLRLQIITAYGGCCVCCKEAEPKFLAVDHINNDGKLQRKKYGTGINFYRYIIRNNFPTDLQLLCHNCNAVKEYYEGPCPHQITH